MADADNKNEKENTTSNKEKVKKDKENEKLKTSTENKGKTDSSTPKKDSDIPEAVDSKDDTKHDNFDKASDTKDENTEHVDTKANDTDVDNVNTNADKEQTTDVKTSKKDNKAGKSSDKASTKVGESSVGSVPVTKLVQSHYKTHTKSTLPHVLTEYGLEDKEHPKKEKRKRRKKKIEVASDTEDDEKSRRKAKDDHFRNMFGNVRETDNYYAEYIDFLEQKVVQQRQKALREKEEAERLRILKLEEECEETVTKVPEVPPPPEPEKQRRRFVRRLERIELKHDDTFLRNIPKTDTARIIALQDKLRKEGKFKSQCDVDKFWDDIRKPHVFYEHFKVKKRDAVAYDLSDDDQQGSHENIEALPGPEMAPRSLSHISEASKDRDSWAITQKFGTSHGPKTPHSGRKRKDSTQMAKEAAVDLEKRCPKLEMPPLACFSLKLGEKPPDPEEITRKLELKAREKSRKKFQRKLNKMYQMAMTNTAAANRIMAQHGNITDILDGAGLRDLLAVFDEPYPTLEDYYRDIADPSRAMEDHPGIDRQSIGSRSQPSTRQSSAASRKLTPISDTSSSKSRKKRKSPKMIELTPPLPLSYNEMTSKEKTMEPKCMSTLWTNYMHAGKSVFSQ
ncbi:eukaryotic translation initiation factor 5B-like isoform X2 [Ruditapes philippinarum]|uniref:eukaryotic translation initiation factor 5B-like isoform X2 n=1 Tax=Ruditapes philippinarum TaxID=129788 RepID=UPI00295AF239|nr:eukaryotic translation initiation factor 5B-like isoform X2 [Ruditapes philippinarum]